MYNGGPPRSANFRLMNKNLRYALTAFLARKHLPQEQRCPLTHSWFSDPYGSPSPGYNPGYGAPPGPPPSGYITSRTLCILAN